MADSKRRIPHSISRLAKLASLASLPTIHAEQEVLQEITPLLSDYGASPEFVAPNMDNTGYYILYNKQIFFVQIQKKWELGSISNTPVQHEIPLIIYKEKVENIVAFVTSTIDEDFVFCVHKDHRNPRSLSDMETRWLRFQSSEHVDEFIGHCLAMSAPQLLSKARMLMFQSGSGTGSNMSSMSASEVAAETERLKVESERTLVVTDLVVKSVTDLLTRVKEEVVTAMKKSADFSARWGTKYNKIAALNVTMKDQQQRGHFSSGDDAGAQHGIKTCEYDFQHVARNPNICARIKGLGGSKILFSCEAHLSDNTHEMAIITDRSLRLEKLRKDREVHVIPFNAIEEVVHENPADKDASPKVLIKVDFSICTKIRGDVMLRFPSGPNGIRQKNLFLVTLTSAYEASVVTHLTITESTDVFWARRGTVESQLVRMMRAIRPDEDNPRTQTVSAANANSKLIMNARLALYLCLKQPHRVISSLSACSTTGVNKQILAFLARTMHRIFLAHQEAVAQDHELHQKDDEYKNHGDLRCIPFVQPCVDYEVSSYKFHRNRINETRAKAAILNASFNSNSFNEDDEDNQQQDGSDLPRNRQNTMTSGSYDEEYYSKSTADSTLLVPPSFGSSDCFASLALKEYIGSAGSSFVSLCVGRPMEDFSSNPQTLQPMTLQNKQHWAAQFLRHLRNIVLGDGVDEVLPGAFKVVVALIWQHFERDRQRTGERPGDHHHPGNNHSHSSNNILHSFDEVTVVGGFLFNQFLRPALHDPLTEGLISSELSEVQQKNLEDVTCLIECVLTQSDLPLATRQNDFSTGQRNFLRRFVDNEVQDAHRMLRSLVYPEISNDDPEDDGSAVPDFFPPPVPGEINYGSVSLMPFGDPRTVESFWNKYVLKMPIDLHNLKLLQAFTLAMKSVSLQALTAAFTPQLHEHGMDLSSVATSTTQQQNQQYNNHQQSSAFESATLNFNTTGRRNNSNNNNLLSDDGTVLSPQNGDDDDDASPPASPRMLGSSVSFKFNNSSNNNNIFGSSSNNAMSRNQNINNNASNSASPSSTSGAGGGRTGRMRSSTLIRAESTAAERSAIAERTIHRLTLEVKSLKEQVAQARQAELETRMAAARAMEQFSHSFAMQMTRTAQAAQRAQKKATGQKSGSGRRTSNSSGSKKKKHHRRRKNSGNNNSSDSSSSDDDSTSSSSDDDEEYTDEGGDENGSFAGNNNSMSGTRRMSNPFDENKTGVNMSSVLSTEARWRHSLEHLPAASRSTKGAGSETVFGCPMDSQCLAFLALPMTQSSHPQQARIPVSGGSGRNSPWSNMQQQQQQSANPLDFNNFSFNGNFRLDPNARN